MRAHPVGPGRRADGQHPGRPARRRAVQVLRRLDRSRREGRAAAAQAARARRASSATSSSRWRLGEREAVSARPDLHRSRAIRPSTPTARSSASPNTAERSCRSSIPMTNTATTSKLPVRDPSMPLRLGPGHAASLKPLGPSPYWGDESDLGQQGQQPQLDVRPDGPRLARRGGARPGQSRRSASRARIHPSAKLFPLERDASRS